MGAKTLAEAKAALAAEEAKAAAAAKAGNPPPSNESDDEHEDEGTGDDTVTGEDTLGGDDEGAGDEDGAGDDTVTGDDTAAGGDDTVAGGENADDWMRGDEDEGGEHLPDSEAAKIRRKYQAPLKEAKKELEALREENARLKKQGTPAAAAPAIGPRPQRAAYKTDEEFQVALAQYVAAETAARSESERKAREREQAIETARQTIAVDVDKHYLRAAALAKKSNITAEAYQAADRNVRAAFEEVRPGDGDTLADGFIHLLGEGSERVMYKLGVSKAHRDTAAKLLREDPSGMRLGVWLGKLNAELGAPIKRTSTAPPPAPRLSGDKANGASAGAKMKREYDEALSKGNTQKAFNLKKTAKAKKIDVRGW
jgi:hypothetical protein